METLAPASHETEKADQPALDVRKNILQKKFDNPLLTANGEPRAYVDLVKLDTLWINTGTLCNIECLNCYIESSPKNDRLVYIRYDEVAAYLDEIERDALGTREIGITGGEPFMNRDIIRIMELCLTRGFELIVLTNAMRPMMRYKSELLALHARFGDRLTMRVSVDHYTKRLHEEERGPGTWRPMLDGLKWLSDNGFTLDIAGRTRWGENEGKLREGYGRFFTENRIAIDAENRKQLVLFPEMDPNATVPEITHACWSILNVDPNRMMCASSRMVVKRKGAEKPAVITCTLLPYEEAFELKATLKESATRTRLNHPFCSKFCVLGGGACSLKEE